MSDKLNNEHHKDSESSQNLYSNQYEQDQLAGLEENAPQLNAPVDRTVNKKAIAFIVAAGFGLAGLGAFIINLVALRRLLHQNVLRWLLFQIYLLRSLKLLRYLQLT